MLLFQLYLSFDLFHFFLVSVLRYTQIDLEGGAGKTVPHPVLCRFYPYPRFYNAGTEGMPQMYQCNLEYLGKLCELISEKYNKEYIWGEEENP